MLNGRPIESVDSGSMNTGYLGVTNLAEAVKQNSFGISATYLTLRHDSMSPEFSGNAYGYAILLWSSALVGNIVAWCFMALRP